MQIEIKCCEFDSFAALRHCIKEYIKQAAPKEYSLVEIAMNEAINNAFLYGSQHRDKSPSRFFVTFKIYILNKTKLVIRIKDEGPGFPVQTKLQQLRAHGPELFESMLWEESGRGIAIMLQVMDLVIYNKQGNEVLMVKRLTSESGDSCEMVG